MQGRFTNISEVIEVDFAEEDETRLNILGKAIRYHASKLPLVGSPVPAKWTVIREALETDPRKTITLQDYLKICADHEVTEMEDALVLGQYFHDIGVFLHFQDDELLKKTIFLKPNWATNAVYKILDDELLNKKVGRFNAADASAIWCEDDYQLVCDELLRLMQKFFLTYRVEETGEYIVPDRLPAAQPKYDWDEKGNLLLRYEYDVFMPKGIMSQFTVQMHRYVANHDHVWRRGVVIERENTAAEIVESYDAKKIWIRVSGQNRRDFMTIITEEIDKINSQYEKMKVDKMIPCNCAECQASDSPHFYEYKDLRRRLEKGRSEVECANSYEMINVRGLIDEVINETIRGSREREGMLEEDNLQPEEVKRDRVFISYSHDDDKKWLERVQTHLKVLENEGVSVKLWDDTQIESGMIWRDEIEKGLVTTKVAILLVSTNFLASDFIHTEELPSLLDAAKNDGAVILPLILEPCRFTSQKRLAVFQSVNDPEKPLSDLTEGEQKKILVELQGRIAKLMDEGAEDAQ